jgi:hypothetical protein
MIVKNITTQEEKEISADFLLKFSSVWYQFLMKSWSEACEILYEGHKHTYKLVLPYRLW